MIILISCADSLLMLKRKKEILFDFIYSFVVNYVFKKLNNQIRWLKWWVIYTLLKIFLDSSNNLILI